MSKKDQKTLVDAIKSLLKENATVQKMFADYGVDIEKIDEMPLEFAPLKVSAKTKDGKVILNDKLLEDGDFTDDIHYIVHEATHWLQQTTGEADKHSKKGKAYLDLPTEIEAFQNQTRFMRDFYGPKESDKYVEELLDFHEYKGKERDQKRAEILGE